jgi:hypothetical protein
VFKEKQAMRAFSRQQRMQGRTVALVPTMVRAPVPPAPSRRQAAASLRPTSRAAAGSPCAGLPARGAPVPDQGSQVRSSRPHACHPTPRGLQGCRPPLLPASHGSGRSSSRQSPGGRRLPPLAPQGARRRGRRVHLRQPHAGERRRPAGRVPDRRVPAPASCPPRPPPRRPAQAARA